MYTIRVLSCVWLFVVVLSFAPVRSQDLSLAFKHLSVKEGLSQNPVFSLFQDKTGFIWIGGRDGLIRYDGYEFKKYLNNRLEKQSIIHNDVLTVYEDRYRRLWIGTSNGAFLFNRLTSKFDSTPVSDAILVSSFQPDSLGNLWMATVSGLKCIDLKTNSLVSSPLTGPGSGSLLKGRIESLFLDRDQQLWVGSDKGVACIDPKKKTIKPLPYQVQSNAKLSSAKVFVINQDFQHHLWFGTKNDGAFEYNPETGTCINYVNEGAQGIASDFVHDIFVYDANKIWFGTRDGLSILDKHTGKIRSYPHDPSDPKSLSHNTIWKFMRDGAGNVWLGTYAGGVNIYNTSGDGFLNIGERIGKRFGLNAPVANAILCASNDRFWVGTDGGGLNYLDRSTNTATYFPLPNLPNQRYGNIVKSLATDQKGNLLVGTLEGLATFDVKSKTFGRIPLTSNNLGDNVRINTILQQNGHLWLGTELHGMIHITPDRNIEVFKSGTHRDSISHNYITSLINDEYSNIWLATGNGLDYYVKNQRRFIHYPLGKLGSRDNFVTALFYDRRKRLWAGTVQGLFVLNRRTMHFQKIVDQTDYLSEQVQAIIEDKFDNIWLSTANGINKLIFKDLEVPWKKNNVQVDHYTVTDGLLSNQFILGAVAKNSKGELFFGGVNGLSYFYPERLLKNQHQPQVVITELQVHNKAISPLSEHSPLKESIEDTKDIVLPYNQNNITLRFAALNYINPQNNQYAYKLKGLTNQKNWQYIGNQRTATYTNLEPGDYQFFLKAANNDGVWSNKESILHITILPPYWRTWWAYLIYVIVTALIVYQLVRISRTRTRLKYELYLEHLENERQKELHRVKMDFFTNISHEIRTPLTLISGPLEKLIDDIPKKDPSTMQQLNLIKSNSDRLTKLVGELLDFRKVETGNMKLWVSNNDMVAFLEERYQSFMSMAATRKISYQFLSLTSPVMVYFDRDQMHKVVFNLLTNAFKFTPDGGEITLALSDEPDQVQIHVQDNGIGIPQEKQKDLFTLFYQVGSPAPVSGGTGIGLALSKNIVNLHQGTVNVQSKPLEMTVFSIVLKKGNDHFTKEQLIDLQQIPTFVDEPPIHIMEDMVSDENSNATTENLELSVLIVEDNDELRTFLRSILYQQYQVYEAANGLDGLTLATELLPDLIISDVIMPKMTGLELADQLKSKESTAHIPIILLTARATEIDHLQGLENGADLYLTKPFKPKVLSLQVRNLLTTRENIRRRFNALLPLEVPENKMSATDQRFMEKLNAYINNHMSDPEFSIPVLSSEIGMSQPVLYRKIKALTDLSVNNYVKSMRMKKAAELLLEKELTIYEISYEVGFNDSKYFSKEFARQYGKNPTAYRNGSDI